MDSFKYVGNGVVKHGEEMFLVNVNSSRVLSSRLYGDDVHYGITYRDIEIELQKKNHLTDAVLVIFSRDNSELGNNEKMPEESYLDMIISPSLGTFISDWY